jgi:putative tryptophan/tyrosine transport system substrate-binding protein
MRRRQFITILVSAAAIWPLTARTQQHERVRRIVVWVGRAEDDAEAQRQVTAFRQGLQALGWTDGHNIRTDYRWELGDSDHRQTIAQEIVEQRPDVIVCSNTLGVAALARENRTIPIVFAGISDPVGSGFVANLAHPGGMVTGFTFNEPTLGSKWPELLKELAPEVRRMGFLFNPDTAPYADAFVQQAEPAARALGVERLPTRVHNVVCRPHPAGCDARGVLIISLQFSAQTRLANC